MVEEEKAAVLHGGVVTLHSRAQCRQQSRPLARNVISSNKQIHTESNGEMVTVGRVYLPPYK